MKRLKKFLCWLGWHPWVSIGFDGCSIRGRCRWCGGVGLVDSQGNLFAVQPPAAAEEGK